MAVLSRRYRHLHLHRHLHLIHRGPVSASSSNVIFISSSSGQGISASSGRELSSSSGRGRKKTGLSEHYSKRRVVDLSFVYWSKVKGIQVWKHFKIFEQYRDRGSPSGTLASGIGDVSALPSSSPFSWLFGSPDLPCMCLGLFGSPKPFFESM